MKRPKTNFLIKGKAEVWFESKQGFTEKKKLFAASIWCTYPEVEHRIITLEDLILLEASTPEVDDLTRIADDTMRGDGRKQSEHDVC